MNALTSVLREGLTKVQPSGKGFVLATCPVHKGGRERNPSFSVNTYTGSYHCFSCGIKGDFADLQRLLRIRIDADVLEKQDTSKGPENDRVNEAILGIFKQCPLDLLAAGFSEETLYNHEIGFDDLYQRTTFPIRDVDGRLVAISGRSKPGEDPRYKVYTHYMLRGAADNLYSPRSKRFLYGGHTVKPGAPSVVLVEGYKGCLWVRQAGFPNTVATMGTKVTDEQIDRLRRLTSRVIILFDMDRSGITEAKSVQTKILRKGVPTTAVQYTSPNTREPSPDDLSADELRAVLDPLYLP